MPAPPCPRMPTETCCIPNPDPVYSPDMSRSKPAPRRDSARSSSRTAESSTAVDHDTDGGSDNGADPPWRQPHDQRLKTLVHEFFPQLLPFFLPEVAELIDFSGAEFLGEEVFPSPPKGPRRTLDIVVRVKLKRRRRGASHCLLIIHVEIEGGRSVVRIGRRMEEYYHALRMKYGIPVLPVVILLNLGLDGIGVREERTSVGRFEISNFRWFYIGLPALDAGEYASRTDNPWSIPLLGLMKHDRKRAAELVAEGMRRVRAIPGPMTEAKYLLAESLQAYLIKDARQRADLDRILTEPKYRRVAKMFPTYAEEAMKKGWMKGKREGKREGLDEGLQAGRALVLDQLDAKFGPVPAKVRKAVEALTPARLRTLGRAILTAGTKADLKIGWE